MAAKSDKGQAVVQFHMVKDWVVVLFTPANGTSEVREIGRFARLFMTNESDFDAFVGCVETLVESWLKEQGLLIGGRRVERRLDVCKGNA